ncbi:MAG: aminotransferase class I/II-fold pyridoxal phosphate-dependent enzyme [Gemmatimonadales bacterium]|nr:aminotransferase class I/II-fold pyridoxal phosphate-dependent enzyme [Gemmatimonadales bacterium]
MEFIPFELERWQSTWENRVRYNLSESGVHPLSITELLALAGGDLEELAALRMVYNQSDGTEELRAAIARLYPGATPDHVTVTVGSAEANFITCWSLIEPGDNVAILTPLYMQTHGLVQNFGATVSEFPLRWEKGWEPDVRDIERAIAPGTKLVVVTNPNNPTGHVLSQDARDAILDRVRATGAWILADEVYQGAELDRVMTPSFWGGTDRVLVVNGLSKAYGLPGLRIGWVVGPKEFKQAVVKRHDYTVIGPSPASDYLAVRALAVREKILNRTRGILNTNYRMLDDWLQGFGTLFDWHKPDCGAICFARYRHSMSALELVERVRADRSILLVPGDHFNFPHYLRLGYGNEQGELEAALAELREELSQVLMD